MTSDTSTQPRSDEPGSWDAAQIALEIRRRLEQGGLEPGDRIGSEHELAAQFRVSRPKLREALRLLASSHLIEAIQGRNGGIFVANTPTEGMSRNLSESIATMLAAEAVTLSELLEVRLFLEVPLAGLAARNVTPDVVAELEQAIADAEGEQPGTPPFNEADARFHRAIAHAVDNGLLAALTSWMLDVLQPYVTTQIGPNVRGQDIIAQHRAILLAIRRARPQAAERAMRDHVAHVQDAVRKISA